MNKKLAMLGCFRSGTNYAKTLLELNYYCEVKNDLYGWKHGFVPVVSLNSSLVNSIDCDGSFFVTKNPFSFIVSLYNYYKEAGLNINAEDCFDEFVTSRIVVFDGANPQSVQYRFSNPVDFWNSMNWNYYSLSGCVHIKYERILSHPKQGCSRVAKKLDLDARPVDFIVPKNKVKRMNDRQTLSKQEDYVTKTKFGKTDYLSHAYMQFYNKKLIRFIIKNLDMELVDRLGYKESVEQLSRIVLDQGLFSFLNKNSF